MESDPEDQSTSFYSRDGHRWGISDQIPVLSIFSVGLNIEYLQWYAIQHFLRRSFRKRILFDNHHYTGQDTEQEQY